jgi:hypothetical protein
VAGGIARTLERAGLPHAEAEQWEQRIARGAVLVGAHVDAASVRSARQILTEQGAARLNEIAWAD